MGHAATQERWQNEFGSFGLSVFAFTHNFRTLWSFDCDLAGYAATSCDEYRSYTTPSYKSYCLRPLSAVGPVVSFAKAYTTYGAGGNRPSHGVVDWTFDVRDGEAASFDALVTPGSLLNALKEDPYLTRTLGEKLQDAQTVDAVFELWGTDDFARFGTYYFHRWSPERKEVAMRISFLERTSGLNPNELRELGIWVTPKAEFVSHFERAAAGEGFFAEEPSPK